MLRYGIIANNNEPRPVLFTKTQIIADDVVPTALNESFSSLSSDESLSDEMQIDDDSENKMSFVTEEFDEKMELN